MRQKKMLLWILLFVITIGQIVPGATTYAEDKGDTDLYFENIEVPYQEMEVVYDSSDGSDGVEPYSLNDDILGVDDKKEEEESKEESKADSQEDKAEALQEDKAKALQENKAEALQENKAEALQENKAEALQENKAEDVSNLPHKFSFEGESEDYYRLSFTIDRYPYRDVDYPLATYQRYWLHFPEYGIFDRDKWQLNDFSVKHNLEAEVDGSDKSFTTYMTYTASSYEFNGEISFENIPIPFEKVEVQYYSPKGKDYFEPYLREYWLFLAKAEDKMILYVPKLEPNEGYTGEDKVLPVKKLEVKELGTKLYLNGNSGEDANDGLSPEKPLKTFAKAKEIAEGNERIKEIIVTGTTPIEGNINGKIPSKNSLSLERIAPQKVDSADGRDIKVVRGEDFDDFLFTVEPGKEATLSNIVIDGNADKNKNIKKSLVEVKNGATLNINDGAVLKNNQIMAIQDTATTGGAIKADTATVNMTGGSIENNQATYGGGVYLYQSTMNFSGGEIKSNESKLVIDASTNQYYSAGGGICANGDSTINMSVGAKVLNNYAKEIGGGISLGSNQWSETNTLNMTGGTVDGNTAGSSGGGIFVQARLFGGGASKANISAGEITNNKMDATGVTEKEFGGAGIYVNGAPKSIRYAGYTYYGGNGELYLTNAIITNNKSKLNGAGYAGCPISKTKFHVTDGVAIYGNDTQDSGKEIYLLSSDAYGLHSGTAEYKLAERMLGGVPNEWRTEDGKLLPLEKYEGTVSANSALELHTNNSGNDFTKALKKVIISGNYSETRGGGIGSNGTVTFGTEGETTEISVKKVWEDNNNADKKRPASIQVQLIAMIANNKYVVETRELNKSNGWETKFSNLPKKYAGTDIVYTVKEVGVEGYASKVTGDEKNGFTITNKKLPPQTPPSTPPSPPKEKKEKTLISVTKIWYDAGNQAGARPSEIYVHLFADGKDTGKVLTLKHSNDWKGVFDQLDVYTKDGKLIHYTVQEEKVESYKSVVSGTMSQGFTIFNTHSSHKVSIPVLKVWEDNENSKGVRPKSILIHLLKNGKETGVTLELNESNSWQGRFDNLEAVENNALVEYTVKEQKIKHYSSEVFGDASTGYVVTNRLQDVPVEKKIVPKPPKPPKPPKQPKLPKTGELQDPLLYSTVALLVGAGFVLVGRKKHHE